MNITESLLNKFLEMLNFPCAYTYNGEQRTTTYESTLKFMCTATVPRNLFLSKYKSLPQIETIDVEEKKKWKAFVNEIFPGTTPQFRLDAVKIIYCIGVISN